MCADELYAKSLMWDVCMCADELYAKSLMWDVLLIPLVALDGNSDSRPSPNVSTFLRCEYQNMPEPTYSHSTLCTVHWATSMQDYFKQETLQSPICV